LAKIRTDTSAGLFTPVTMGRMSEDIVDQIRLLIREGRLTPGDRLPSERDLCERFGVSRVTVREALRILEANGLIEIRVGARGGAFVTAPSGSHIREGIIDLMTMSPTTATEVTETRKIIELGIIPLVCERATEDDLAALQELCDKATAARDAGTYTMEMSAEFHTRLAECTHNRAIVMLQQTFRRPLLMSLEQAHEAAPEMGGRGVTEHAELVAAVRARDCPQATDIMRRHLDRTAARLAKH
jgi:GntR family transcriptional regulator, transcriptional repressor for pyruvate dehydrogenase complex